MYIAASTSQDVCDFLTQLKRDGDFSQEILDIIETHVKTLDTSVADSADESMMGIDEQQAQYVAASRKQQLESVNTPEPTPKKTVFDPIEALRKQRRAWVTKESND